MSGVLGRSSNYGDRPLPRQTFRSAADAALEEEVAIYLESQWHYTYAKLGKDDPNRQKSRIDGLFHCDGTVMNFVEIKGCGRRFDDPFLERNGWLTAEKKVFAARTLYEIVRLPILIIVHFQCGTIAHLNAASPYTRIASGGRTDRDSPGDLEPMACFNLGDMVVVRAARADQKENYLENERDP